MGTRLAAHWYAAQAVCLCGLRKTVCDVRFCSVIYGAQSVGARRAFCGKRFGVCDFAARYAVRGSGCSVYGVCAACVECYAYTARQKKTAAAAKRFCFACRRFVVLSHYRVGIFVTLSQSRSATPPHCCIVVLPFCHVAVLPCRRIAAP